MGRISHLLCRRGQVVDGCGMQKPPSSEAVALLLQFREETGSKGDDVAALCADAVRNALVDELHRFDTTLGFINDGG
jgi:hypothetical protein